MKKGITIALSQDEIPFEALTNVTFDMQECQACHGVGCDYCLDGILPTLTSLHKVRAEKSALLRTLRYSVKVIELVVETLEHKRFIEWNATHIPTVFEDWLAVVVTEEKVGMTGKPIDEENPLSALTEKMKQRVFDGNGEWTKPTVGEEGCVVLLEQPGRFTQFDVEFLFTRAIDVLGEQWVEHDAAIEKVKTTIDAIDSAERGVKALRSFLKQDPIEEPAIELKEMIEHHCECGKVAAAQDEDGKWYCKKHAYPLGLLDRPKWDEPDADPAADIQEKFDDEFEKGIGSPPKVWVDPEVEEQLRHLPAHMRRRMGK
jgi:hypothetical protein